MDNENILEIVEIGRLLFIDGCGCFEKDFNLGEEAFLASIKLEKRKKGSKGNG